MIPQCFGDLLSPRQIDGLIARLDAASGASEPQRAVAWDVLLGLRAAHGSLTAARAAATRRHTRRERASA